jgi:hypothetical protein
MFLQYWEAVENTGYAKAIKIAVRDLYGIDRFKPDTWIMLKEAMEKRRQPGFHRWVLYTMAKIDAAINDVVSLDVDEGQFPVMRFDDYATPLHRGDIHALSTRSGVSIHSLDDLIHALEAEFAALSRKIVGVKIGLAYMRSLYFEKTSRFEAEAAFNRIYRTRTFGRREIMPYPGRAIATYAPHGIGFEEAKPLQDYIVHRILSLAEKHSLPVQIHTGIHEGNENIISNSNPVLLTNLFMEYQKVKFDVFHCGYPYYRELAVLAKNFPNVYPDLCWMHVVSPNAARTILSEWLDLIPSNKILAFGGDYRFVEGVYGHASLARRNVASVLQCMVLNGELEMRRVPYLASRLLRENAKSLYGLSI